jgi:pimeloyl-ACP methyl ester carboxylesterase
MIAQRHLPSGEEPCSPDTAIWAGSAGPEPLKPSEPGLWGRVAVGAVAAAIDEPGGRALVVGLSLGGYVAQAVAGRDPQRVAGLVAFGSTAVAGGMWGGVYHLLAGVATRHAETGNRLSAWGFRRALPAPVAEAVVAGGMSCEVMQQAVDAFLPGQGAVTPL